MSDFYCTQCGNKGIPIIRKENKQREPGHLKKLYCISCGKEINHVEIKDFGKYTKEDFDIEFQYGNFDIKGNRIEPNYKIFKQKILNQLEKKKEVLNNG